MVARAEKIVLPGVGHFAATSTLSEAGLREAIGQSIERGVPFLGICVGMQWMIEASQEAPNVPGLALWPGECERFPASVKSPHVGWNQIGIRHGASRLLQGIPSDSFVYFTHSFRVPLLAATVAECEYGESFPRWSSKKMFSAYSSIPRSRGAVGLKLLENFCQL